jgi:hypothetical protein
MFGHDFNISQIHTDLNFEIVKLKPKVTYSDQTKPKIVKNFEATFENR